MRENSLGAAEIRGADVEFLLFLSSRRFLPARSLAFSNVCTDRETGKGYSVAGKQADQTLFTFSFRLQLTNLCLSVASSRLISVWDMIGHYLVSKLR